MAVGRNDNMWHLFVTKMLNNYPICWIFKGTSHVVSAINYTNTLFLPCCIYSVGFFTGVYHSCPLYLHQWGQTDYTGYGSHIFAANCNKGLTLDLTILWCLHIYLNRCVCSFLCLQASTSEDDDAACRGSICYNSRTDGHPVTLLYSQNRGRTPCRVLQVSQHWL